MSGTDDEPRHSRRRFVLRELAILAIGVVVLFVAIGLIVYFGAPLVGLKMCCQ